MILPTLGWLRSHWWLGAALLAVAVGIFALVDRGDVGTLYTSLADFEKRQRARDYVIVGRFGNITWPALAIASETGEGGVAFRTPQGQPHRYRNFEGRMKALTLTSGLGADKRFVIVLREGAGPPAGRHPGGTRYLR